LKVPFIDIGLQHKKIEKELVNAIKKVIKRGDFILGEDVSFFENEFARFCGSKYALGVGSGTEALFLALKSLEIGPCDEVIVPAFTYIATAFAVTYTGAKPVFVDIDEGTYNIDVKKIEQAITKKTRAILPVHLYGQPANMPEILKIAKKYNLKVIEDAAQAHGAEIKFNDGIWKKTGCLGDIGCFSFYPTKNMGGFGDGGLITTNNESIYKKLYLLRDFGQVKKYHHSIVGYNSRLDTIQAACLRIKLKKLQTWNRMRVNAAKIYDKLLNSIPDIRLPVTALGSRHIYHVYAVRVKNRDEVCRQMKNKGIGSIIYYPIALHLQEAYKDLGYKSGDFPVAEKISLEIMSLPIYPYITEKQIEYTVNTLKSVYKNIR